MLNCGKSHVWLLAIRPKTLPAAVAPVLMGGAMAFGDNVFRAFPVLIALACALLIQAGTNLVNDYSDFRKGADNVNRIGPLRVTQAGLVTPREIMWAIRLTFGAAIFLSLYLVRRGGWPVIIIGAISILSGILYTAGPKPYGYIGLGDLFVLIFFGPVAVGGTYYVQALAIPWPVIVAGFGPGLLSVAVLTVNNLRDIAGDAVSGKKTLAVRFGPAYAKNQYYISIVLASIIPAGIALLTSRRPWSAIAALTLFFALPVLETVFTRDDGPSLNGALAATGKLLLIYALLFSLGWIIAP